MPSLVVDKNISLAKYTSWKIGGPAEYFCLPENLEQMIEAEAYANKNSLKMFVLGSGSNVLVPDEGIQGLVICTKKYVGIKTSIDATTNVLRIECAAGESKNNLLKAFLQYNLPPAVMLVGLPGDIGGGIVMNAGVSDNLVPREFVEITDWFDVLYQGKIKRLSKNDVQWSYRNCQGWQPGIVVAAGLSWSLQDVKENLADEVKNLKKKRMEKQPLDLPSCGSVFMNPKPHFAGKLIEDCGLKSYRIGDAQVSPKHANFIVNLGNATAKDTRDLIEYVQKVVLQKTGIELHKEVKFL